MRTIGFITVDDKTTDNAGCPEFVCPSSAVGRLLWSL